MAWREHNQHNGEIPVPKWFKSAAFTIVGLLIFVTIIKILFQVNSITYIIAVGAKRGRGDPSQPTSVFFFTKLGWCKIITEPIFKNFQENLTLKKL